MCGWTHNSPLSVTACHANWIRSLKIAFSSPIPEYSLKNKLLVSLKKNLYFNPKALLKHSVSKCLSFLCWAFEIRMYIWKLAPAPKKQSPVLNVYLFKYPRFSFSWVVSFNFISFNCFNKSRYLVICYRIFIWLIILCVGKSAIEGVNFLSNDDHAEFSYFLDSFFFPPKKVPPVLDA